MGLQRVTYRYTGAAPVEEVLEVGGRPIEPPWAKRADAPRTSGARLLHERILWLPLDRADVEVRLGGRSMRIRPEAPVRARRPETDPRQDRGHRRARSSLRRPAGMAGSRTRTPSADALVRLHARMVGAVRYRDAWVVMDRIHDADDNGERLFEYLRDGAARRQRVVRPRGRHAGLAPPPAGRGHPPRRARVPHVAVADAQRPLAAVLPLGRCRSSDPADVLRLAPNRAWKLRLPPARRDQGRPVAVAQPARPRPVRREHGARARVDRGRRDQLRRHRARRSG